MDQNAKAQAFKGLHVKGTPLVLYNVWDAGSARSVADAGAPAIATGSWSVAGAQGADDGEALPMADAMRSARQIAAAVDLPVSIDFEGGYAVAPEEVARNVGQLIDTGVIGLNFEDRVVGGEGVHDVATQAARIAAIRSVAAEKGVDLFINARTDLFLQNGAEAHEGLMEDALARAAAYRVAGADGLFVPGLRDAGLIARVCAEQEMPVNIMRKGQAIADLAALGVARISHGPAPFVAAMQAVKEAAQELY